MLSLLVICCLREILIFSFGVTEQTEKSCTGSGQIVTYLVIQIRYVLLTAVVGFYMTQAEIMHTSLVPVWSMMCNQIALTILTLCCVLSDLAQFNSIQVFFLYSPH